MNVASSAATWPLLLLAALGLTSCSDASERTPSDRSEDAIGAVVDTALTAADADTDAGLAGLTDAASEVALADAVSDATAATTTDSAEADAPTQPDALDAQPAGAEDVLPEPDTAPEPPKPPFPIVLAHGFFGFNDFAGAGFIDYFYKVKPALEKKGELLVYTPAVDPFESSEVRGAALWQHIQTILAQTGKQKVVLIGHSQGGLDARVIAHQHPEAVAALVTVATPHGGSPVADAVLFVTPGPISKGIVEALGKLVGGVINPESDNSLMAAFDQLSTKQAEAFDKLYPLPTAIPVWSIAGRTLYAGKGGVCSSSNTPWFISKWHGETDPVNALLLAFTAAMVGQTNDGLVPVESAKRGTFLGCIPADHLDQIGHILGQPPGLFNSFDHKEFWLDLVQWVRAQGY